MDIVHKKIDEKSDEVKDEIMHLLKEFKSDQTTFEKETKAFSLMIQNELEVETKWRAGDWSEIIDLLKSQKEHMILLANDVDNMIKSSTGLSDTIICILELQEIN